MDVVIDWGNMPWNEPEGEPQPGYRDKTCVHGGQEVWLAEFTEGYGRDWSTQGHLLHVLEGGSTLRLRDGDRAIRNLQGFARAADDRLDGAGRQDVGNDEADSA